MHVKISPLLAFESEICKCFLPVVPEPFGTLKSDGYLEHSEVYPLNSENVSKLLGNRRPEITVEIVCF